MGCNAECVQLKREIFFVRNAASEAVHTVKDKVFALERQLNKACTILLFREGSIPGIQSKK
jgi:hypothetical protein